MSYRSAVLNLHPRKPRKNSSEPSEYSAVTKLHFLTVLCQCRSFVHPSVVLSSEEEDEGEDEGDSSWEEVPGTSEPVQVGGPRYGVHTDARVGPKT